MLHCAYCLFGNVFIIIIVYRNRALRKTIDYFIVNSNLAFSDLFFPLIVLPVKVTEWVTESLHWHVDGMLGSIFYKLFYFASSVSLLVSAQSLVWIAIDRFVTVVSPIKLGLITRKIRTILQFLPGSHQAFSPHYFPLLKTWELVKLGNNAFCRIVNKLEQSIFPNTEAGEGYIVLLVSCDHPFCHDSVIPDNHFVFCDSNFLKKTR